MKFIYFKGPRQIKINRMLELALTDLLCDIIDAESIFDFYSDGKSGWDAFCEQIVTELCADHPQIRLHIAEPVPKDQGYCVCYLDENSAENIAAALKYNFKFINVRTLEHDYKIIGEVAADIFNPASPNFQSAPQASAPHNAQALLSQSGERSR